MALDMGFEAGQVPFTLRKLGNTAAGTLHTPLFLKLSWFRIAFSVLPNLA